MRPGPSRFDRPLGQLLALLLIPVLLTLGCPPGGTILGPQAGVHTYQEVGSIPVPGGRVNAIGGNFFVERVDLSIDTRLGRYDIGSVYNSSKGVWHWNFQATYDGSTFVDRSGAVHDITAIADGATVPGTHWVKVDADTVRTKGGLVFDFDASGLLEALHWTSSTYPSLAFVAGAVAGGQAVVRVDQCATADSCQLLHDVGHDASGRVVSIVDRAGRVADFAYDTAGNLSAARDGLDTARSWPGFRYEYAGTKLTAITNSEGERVEYAYNGARLRQVEQIGGSNPIQRLLYEAKTDGLYTTRHIDATGVEVRYRYDDERRLFEVETVATNEITFRQWSEKRLVGHTDPAGVSTGWIYAGEDVVTRADPSGNIVSFSYEPGGVNRENPQQNAIASITDLVGPVETRTYDAAGRLLSVANGEGDARGYTYDATEMIATLTEKGVIRAFSQYGEHGHAARVTTAGVSQDRVFDAVGNRRQGGDGVKADPGGILRRTFDEDRNLAQLELRIWSASETITLEYRSDRQRTAVRRAGGADHEFVYDAHGRQVEGRERVDGVWRSTMSEYDAAGRLTAEDRANATRQELAYGSDGRVATIQRLRNGNVESVATFSYAAGRLESIHDSITNETELYAYDPSGRLASQQFSASDELRFDYDLRSRLVTESFVETGLALTWVAYGYDLANRQDLVADPSGNLIVRAYTDGRLTQTDYGNGVSRSFTYGAEGLLTGSTSIDASGATIEATTVNLAPGYGYIFTHNATTTTWGGVAATTDEFYLLGPAPVEGTSTEGPSVFSDMGSTGGKDFTYAYDPRSNLLAKDDRTLSYNAEGNRLLAVKNSNGAVVRAYTYDDAGFVTNRGGVPLTWSAAGQLLSYGANTIARDALGRILSTTLDGVTTTMRWGGRVVADATGVPLSLDLDEVKIDLVGGGHLYRHLDFRGNVKFTTGDAGTVRSHYRYTAYGLDQVFGLDEDGVRFVTRPEFGDLMLMGARVYDPDVGRFLSPDPVFQIVNQYAYTLSNPVWFEDRTGRSPEIVIAVMAFVGTVSGFLGAAFMAGGVGAGTIFGVGVGLAVFGGALVVGATALALMMVIAAANKPLPSPPPPSPDYDLDFTIEGLRSSEGGDVGCSPISLTVLPDAAPWLWGLIPLQLLLGLMVLRRRRR